MQIAYSSHVETLNHLPFHINKINSAFCFEEDIIQTICKGNEALFKKHFYYKAYLAVFEFDGKYPLINVLNTAYAVSETLSDTNDKNEEERELEQSLRFFKAELAATTSEKPMQTFLSKLVSTAMHQPSSE
ncbi:hypothetical protein [Bacillus sp. Marseille-P3800]|uniref:hypothetical protein n=1 Tax=Bacillus sp. Marseille-P3800 TaxID=2014782 RepID=UPI000C073FB1|nr:hypothetical protein [Bacillus sp. Marseille-P3800]